MPTPSGATTAVRLNVDRQLPTAFARQLTRACLEAHGHVGPELSALNCRPCKAFAWKVYITFEGTYWYSVGTLSQPQVRVASCDGISEPSCLRWQEYCRSLEISPWEEMCLARTDHPCSSSSCTSLLVHTGLAEKRGSVAQSKN